MGPPRRGRLPSHEARGGGSGGTRGRRAGASESAVATRATVRSRCSSDPTTATTAPVRVGNAGGRGRVPRTVATWSSEGRGPVGRYEVGTPRRRSARRRSGGGPVQRVASPRPPWRTGRPVACALPLAAVGPPSSPSFAPRRRATAVSSRWSRSPGRPAGPGSFRRRALRAEAGGWPPAPWRSSAAAKSVEAGEPVEEVEGRRRPRVRTPMPPALPPAPGRRRRLRWAVIAETPDRRWLRPTRPGGPPGRRTGRGIPGGPRRAARLVGRRRPALRQERNGRRLRERPPDRRRPGRARPAPPCRARPVTPGAA